MVGRRRRGQSGVGGLAATRNAAQRAKLDGVKIFQGNNQRNTSAMGSVTHKLLARQRSAAVAAMADLKATAKRLRGVAVTSSTRVVAERYPASLAADRAIEGDVLGGQRFEWLPGEAWIAANSMGDVRAIHGRATPSALCAMAEELGAEISVRLRTYDS